MAGGELVLIEFYFRGGFLDAEEVSSVPERFTGFSWGFNPLRVDWGYIYVGF